jgi:peptide/nickel transport system ATP-binding protein
VTALAHPEALEVEDLVVKRVSDGVPVVRGVSLSVQPGEAIAIVGESGSGKSMTARAIVGLLPPGLRASGVVRYGSTVLLNEGHRHRHEWRGGTISMVFQDPFSMLNPVRRAGTHIAETLKGRRGKADLRSEVERRLAEVGINDGDVSRKYPFELSGGMRQRVALAAALAADPQLLILDEPTTALDVTTQREILAVLREVQRRRAMSMIMITHDLRVAFALCDRVYVMYAGVVVEYALAPHLLDRPRHPYTHGLLLAEPPADRRVPTLVAIPGSVPPPGSVGEVCAFADRCRWVDPRCLSAAPSLQATGMDEANACLRAEEIERELDVARREFESQGDAVADEVSPEVMVNVRSLVKTFPSRGGPGTRALRGVSIHIGTGETVGLVGESGSGKTTLGRCIAELETPDGGVIEIEGRPIGTEREARSGERRTRRIVQMVFQDPYASLNPMRTVGWMLLEALRQVHPHATEADVQALLGRVGLEARHAEVKPAYLSGGERQRVALARALAVEPRVLICDEPVSALDVSVQAQILTLIRSLPSQERVACLFITHDLAVARQVADRVYVMKDGSVIESGQTGVVLSKPQHPYSRQLIDSIPQPSHVWLNDSQDRYPVEQVRSTSAREQP